MEILTDIKRKIRYYDSRVWYLFVSRIFNALGFSVVLPFLSLYLHQDLQVSMGIIGSIFLISAVARAGSQYLAGELSDRLGRKKVLLVGAMGRVVIFAMLGIIVYRNWGFLALGVGIVLSYIFGGMFFTSADTMIADIVVPDDRVEVYALQRIAVNLGWAIGPAAAGLLAHLPFYSLFFITSLIFIIPVTVVHRWISESWPVKKSTRKPLPWKINLGIMKEFFIFCIFILMIFSVITQIITTVAVFSVEIIGISKSQLAWLFSLNGMLIVLFQFHATKLIRKISLTFALFTGSLLIMLGYLVIPFSRGIWALVASIIFITLGEIFTTPSGTALVSRWAPEAEKGRYLGIYGLFMAFGRSVGPFYGGVLMDHFENDRFMLWGIIAAVPLLAGLGFQWIGRIIPRRINRE